MRFRGSLGAYIEGHVFVTESVMLQVRNLQGSKRLNVLFLYDAMSMYINTVYDHLASFSYYSRHNVVYTPAAHKIPLNFSLDLFDVVVVHYSVRIALDWHISPQFREAITKFKGQKIAFIQDEYDNTWHSSMMLNQLGIDLVFTCVPEDKIRTILFVGFKSDEVCSRIDRVFAP